MMMNFFSWGIKKENWVLWKPPKSTNLWFEQELVKVQSPFFKCNATNIQIFELHIQLKNMMRL